jgi:hypothetical protein
MVRFAAGMNYLRRSHLVLNGIHMATQAFTIIDRWWRKRLLGETYVTG